MIMEMEPLSKQGTKNVSYSWWWICSTEFFKNILLPNQLNTTVCDTNYSNKSYFFVFEGPGLTLCSVLSCINSDPISSVYLL